MPTRNRARVVRDPHSVLAEFGTTVPEGLRIAVMHSNADAECGPGVNK